MKKKGFFFIILCMLLQGAVCVQAEQKFIPLEAPDSARIFPCGSYSEGLLRALLAENGEQRVIYYDREGKIAVSMDFNYGREFSEGLAAVTRKGEDGAECGYIDKTGKLVIPYQPYVMAYPFYEGRARVLTRDGKNGFIDKTGKLAVPAKHSQYMTSWIPRELEFCQGVARLGIQGEIFVDAEGNVLKDS